MTPDLLTENAWLRAELGLVIEATEVDALMTAHGLTPTQARLMLALYNCGRVMGIGLLFDTLPHTCDGESLKAVQVHVAQIRRKVGPDSVRTCWSLGYQITPFGRAAVERAKERGGGFHTSSPVNA